MNVIGVRFKKTGKVQYYDPLKFGFRIGDYIIANTQYGEQIGRVVKIKDSADIESNEDEKITPIIKPATKQDMETKKKNEEKSKVAMERCKEIIKRYGLKMKILEAEYTFDATKLIIYFASEERIDFRELVKDLASEFKVRIELRQVGARDELKSYQNLGICGKEVCCRTFLPDFEPVTIKMAKEQGLQINMPKLSGACSRLMCCIKYEQEVYEEKLGKLPKVRNKSKHS